MKLICPVCRAAMRRENKEAVCENGHRFDYAKSGYLNLLLKQSRTHGDDAAMVRARTGFLESGAYEFLRDELRAISREKQPQVIADLGCGEGYYTKALEAQEKYGFDMSKEALKHAAKNDRSTMYAVASIFHLPLPSDSCDMVLTCFAPAACAEISRIIRRDGIFVFVSPGKRHLFELKEVLYDSPYENRPPKPLDTDLVPLSQKEIREAFTCTGDALMDLFQMTPYAWRTAEEGIRKLRSVPSLDITAEFIIRIYRKP